MATSKLDWNLTSIARPLFNGRDGTATSENPETRDNGKNKNCRKGDIENCNFNIISQNVRGLKTDKVKRETVFNHLKSKGDVIFLQETHSTMESEKLWKNECGNETFFSHGASNSCGVMIILSNTLEIEIKEKKYRH